MPSFAERLSKRLTIAAVAAAIPLQLFVDPAAGWTVRVATALAFIASVLCARRWPTLTPAVTMAVLPLGPALLTVLLHVAALNIFYTLLLTALFGSLLPRIAWNRWTLPRWWALLLGAWALTLALGWPVMIVREAGLRLATLRDVGTLDTWANLTTPQVESWILFVVITQLVGLLWLDWLFASPESRGPSPVFGLLAGVTLSSLVAIYQGTVNIAFLSGGTWPELGRAAGMLIDANAYGTIAAFAGPIAFVSLPALRLRHTRVLQAGALTINWAGVWMSGSRTAFMCGAVGTLLLVYELVRAGRRAPSESRDATPLLAGIAAIVLVLVTLSGAVGPVRRVLAKTDVSAADLWRRGGYGTVATRMFRDYPLTGVGIGSFNWMAPDYWHVMTHERLPFDNAQNWWRHQLVELGVVGSLPVVAWSVVIAWLVVTRRTPEAHRIEAATLRGLLIGLGLASMLGMPTQNPIALLMFFYVAARFENLTNPRIPDPRSRIPAAAWTVAALIAIIYATSQLVLARGSLKPIERAERAQRDYIIGAYTGEPQENGSFNWTRRRATFALQASSRHFLLRFHVEHPDVGTHPVKVRITTSCQTLVDEFLADTGVDGLAFELPEGEPRVVINTEVSRTWRPSDYGQADHRELGVAVDARFLTEREAASQEHWQTMQRCE